MFEPRVGHIHTITRYPQLFHKEIFQIDLCLLEAHLMNHGPNFFAKGTILRQIRYGEADRNVRKLEDKIQFVLLMGKSVFGSFSSLQTELNQDYFVFQSAPNDAPTAILEQEMILNVNQAENLDQYPQSNRLRVNSIIKQGQENIFIQIPFQPVTPWSQPKDFTGTIDFIDCMHLPAAIVEIKGSVHQTTLENLLQETMIEERVGVLIEVPVPKDEEELKITGTVKAIDWQADRTGLHGTITLQVDYRWCLTDPKELSCLAPVIEGDLSAESIETLFLIESRSFHFINTVRIEVPQLKSLNEIKLVQQLLKNSWTKKGILLHADLTWGIAFINIDGVEEYQEYQTYIDELFTVDIEESQKMKLTLVADLQNKIAEYSLMGREIKIIIDFRYSPKIYEKKITTVLQDDASSDFIDAKVLIGERALFVDGSEIFKLKSRPLRIINLSGKLVESSGQAQNGFFVIKGEILVDLTFIDQQGKLHEDFFQIFFKKFFSWDLLTPEIKMEVEGDLQYEHYQCLDMNIEYQYLINVAVKAFHQKIIGIRTTGDLPQSVFQNSIELKQKEKSPRFIENLVVDWVKPLEKGNFQEIATSRVHISRLDYRDSQNAILIRGCLAGELEYWDQKKYLQKLSLDLPFWRFIPKFSVLQLDSSKIIPEICSCSYYPLRTFPWGKGSIKIRLELRLAQSGEDELI